MVNMDIESEIRRNFHKRRLLAEKIGAVDDEIRALQATKNELKGQDKISLTDHELIYLVKSILDNPRPVTKVIVSCASYFNNPSYWERKIRRYKPVSEQLKRVFSAVENSGCPQIQLLKKYNLLKLRKLAACPEVGSALAKLKEWYLRALELDKKNQQIAELECLVVSLRRELKAKDGLIARVETASPRDKAMLLRQQFPKMTTSDISKSIGMSRTTTHKYLREG